MADKENESSRKKNKKKTPQKSNALENQETNPEDKVETEPVNETSMRDRIWELEEIVRKNNRYQALLESRVQELQAKEVEAAKVKAEDDEKILNMEILRDVTLNQVLQYENQIKDYVGQLNECGAKQFQAEMDMQEKLIPVQVEANYFKDRNEALEAELKKKLEDQERTETEIRNILEWLAKVGINRDGEGFLYNSEMKTEEGLREFGLELIRNSLRYYDNSIRELEEQNEIKYKHIGDLQTELLRVNEENDLKVKELEKKLQKTAEKLIELELDGDKIKDIENLSKELIDTNDQLKSELEEMQIKSLNDTDVIKQNGERIKYLEDAENEAVKTIDSYNKAMEDAKNKDVLNKDLCKILLDQLEECYNINATFEEEEMDEMIREAEIEHEQDMFFDNSNGNSEENAGRFNGPWINDINLLTTKIKDIENILETNKLEVVEKLNLQIVESNQTINLLTAKVKNLEEKRMETGHLVISLLFLVAVLAMDIYQIYVRP